MNLFVLTHFWSEPMQESSSEEESSDEDEETDKKSKKQTKVYAYNNGFWFCSLEN